MRSLFVIPIVDYASGIMTAILTRMKAAKIQLSPFSIGELGETPARNDVISILRYVTIACSLIATVVGSLALIGWIIDNELLKSIILTLPSMKANTAIALITAGVALGLSQVRRRLIPVLAVRYLAAGITAVIGLLTFSQYLTGIDLGIDQLFFTEPPGALGTAAPNRMAPNSAALFFLCGTALLLLDSKLWFLQVSQLLNSIAVIIFLPTIIGYLYGIDFIYGVATTTKMAIHTAVAFLCLIIGIFIARPLYGFMSVLSRDDAGGFLARRLSILTVLIPFILGFIILRGFLLNLYDVNFRYLLLIGMCVIVFTVLVWRNAIVLSALDQKRRRGEANLLFLSQATAIINESLDNRTTLKKIADLSVPTLADYCFFDLLLPGGKIKRVAYKHREKRVQHIVSRIARYAPRMNFPANPVIRAITERRIVHVAPVREEDLAQFAQTRKHLSLLRRVRAQELVSVPVIVGKELLGALTFCLARGSKRTYAADDLTLMQDLAFRAAIAIKNAQLYTAQQQAVRMRDDFISVASHELKTPVTSLQLYTQSLEKKLERAKHPVEASYIERMDRQIHRLRLLISDLLDVSRLQAGKLEFRMEAFDIKEVVEDVIETLQPTTDKHLLSTDGSITSQVYGDRDRIGQVLTNLVSNAIKYSPNADNVVIRLRQEKERAVITVRDFGIGIDPKQQARIFERFYRVADTGEHTFPGLGMGLFISREIIRRHDSDISIKSERNKGSEFSFSLRFAK